MTTSQTNAAEDQDSPATVVDTRSHCRRRHSNINKRSWNPRRQSKKNGKVMSRKISRPRNQCSLALAPNLDLHIDQGSSLKWSKRNASSLSSITPCRNLGRDFPDVAYQLHNHFIMDAPQLFPPGRVDPLHRTCVAMIHFILLIRPPKRISADSRKKP
jgi:hypothetical protein